MCVLIVIKGDMDKLVKMTDSFDHTLKSSIKVTQHLHPVIVLSLSSVCLILLQSDIAEWSNRFGFPEKNRYVRWSGSSGWGSGCIIKRFSHLHLSKKKIVCPTFHPVFKMWRGLISTSWPSLNFTWEDESCTVWSTYLCTSIRMLWTTDSKTRCR